MSVGIQIMLWGIAVSIPVIVNLLAKRSDALGLSAMLLLTWVFGRITGALYSPPESMALYPVVDAACGVTAFIAWRTHRAPWKLALVGLFVLQCCTHLAFWVAYPTDNASLWRYIAINNLWFSLELVCVAGGGVWDVARGALSHLLGRSRSSRHARLGS